jgi:hypothetical protein
MTSLSSGHRDERPCLGRYRSETGVLVLAVAVVVFVLMLLFTGFRFYVLVSIVWPVAVAGKTYFRPSGGGLLSGHSLVTMH